MKRLLKPTGSVAHLAEGEEAASDKLVREAILVHSGPDGSEIVFESSDGEIKFDEARIQNIIKCQNALTNDLATGYGGREKMPLGAFPPILDQHESDSVKRINGRLTGELKFEKRDVPGIGPNCACVLSAITFLGEDVVKRVKDGRVYHLSIGIDEETDTLSEVSMVIEPAAPGAMVLKKQNAKGVKTMAKNTKALKARQNRMAKLSAISDGIKGLSAKLVSTKESIDLAKAEGKVITRLSAAMKEGKLTPAEYKKLDVKKLAALGQEALDTVLGTIEAMEPKVLKGQKGSSDALTFSEVGKNLEARQKKQLKAETRKDLIKLGAKVKLSKEDEDQGKDHEMAGGNKEEAINPGHDPHAVPGEMGEHLAHLGKCLAEGNFDKAKEVHAAMMKKMAEGGYKEMSVSDVKSEDQEKNSKDLEGKVDELSTNMARLAGLVNELMDSEKEEGEELSADEDEEKKKLKDKEEHDKAKIEPAQA